MTGLASNATLAAALALAALAAQADDKVGRSIAGNCTGCHGTNGVSAGGMPSLAGVDKDRIAGLMREFRDGKRPATVMHQHAKGYTDEQIDAVAAWFAAQKAR
jgi:sulfide dehydrogenase cytochrome subunit